MIVKLLQDVAVSTCAFPYFARVQVAEPNLLVPVAQGSEGVLRKLKLGSENVIIKHSKWSDTEESLVAVFERYKVTSSFSVLPYYGTRLLIMLGPSANVVSF